MPSRSIDPKAVVLPAPGYVETALIGRGGMGEVVAAEDQRIGRGVALKRMRGASLEPHEVARFLREARIQARLDHPAIVPVYEIGTDSSGGPFFTMKRVAGATLLDKLAESGPLQPLLRAFVDVCMAIELAHSRGVVHRDLKPANIMLGDFNEVYVLDWGVARVLAESPTSRESDISTLDGENPLATAGILGTPGYMSPEQIEGSDVTGKTDVYALGAILFEILTGEPVHPRGRGALAMTLEEPQHSPRARTPDRAIAPELDVACFAALARGADARPTARALGEKVQAYLDGDRDLERRKKLAAEHLVAAQAALAGEANEARSIAMREAGRSLALDPESIDAATLVAELMLEPPKIYPPDLQRSIDRDDREESSKRSRIGMIVYISVFSFLFVVPWMTIASWLWLVALNAVLVVQVAFTWHASRIGRVSVPFAMIGNLLLAITWSRLAGPLMLTPILVCGIMLALSGNPRIVGKKWLLVGWGAFAAALPMLLEAFGVLTSTWSLDHGNLVTKSQIFASPGNIDGVMLVAANTLFVAAIGFYASTTAKLAHDAKRIMQSQKWHLEQMIPKAATRRP